MKKIKIIDEGTYEEVEVAANAWLAENPSINVISLRYQEPATLLIFYEESSLPQS